MFHQFIQNNERILWVVDQILGQFFDYHTHGFGSPLAGFRRRSTP
jgi:hypothetical protein